MNALISQDKPPATWKYLLHLLMDTDMTPYQILRHLNVKPSRLKKLLRSKRLKRHLAAMQGLSSARAGHMRQQSG